MWRDWVMRVVINFFMRVFNFLLKKKHEMYSYLKTNILPITDIL